MYLGAFHLREKKKRKEFYTNKQNETDEYVYLIGFKNRLLGTVIFPFASK